MEPLAALLKKEDTAIVKSWIEKVVGTYPADTSLFLKSQKNPFSNPVGSTIQRSLEGLFQELLHEMDRDRLVSYLDPIIRIRAVQDFTPSEATGFIPLLKAVIREQIGNALDDSTTVDAYLHFENRVDMLCLLAFDVYMECREKVYQIKASQEKKSTYSALERAGLLTSSQSS